MPERACEPDCYPGIEYVQRDGADVVVRWCGRHGVETPIQDQDAARAEWESKPEWRRVDRRPCPHCGIIYKGAILRNRHVADCDRA